MQPHLKIFISSTFTDMHKERQKLITNVFVKFKKLAKQRGVEVTEIELRTGVTDAIGHIAKVCLEQVDRCVESPIFFLGILGSYYGWDEWYEVEEKESLKEEYREIIERYPKISITELEIRYAIENPNHNQALFYVTEPIANEDRRLVALKEELKGYAKERDNLGFDYYESDEEFANKVYRDLSTALNRIYPPHQKPSEVERLRVSHQAFALSRYKGYVRYQANEEILDEFLSSQNQNDRLLLYGESGYGKSALVANYFRRFKERSNSFLIEHYIGGAGEFSSDFYQMLRRVMLEIKEEFEIGEDVPTEHEKIINEFGLWLQKVKRQTVIVLDGYNQIDDDVKERFLEFYLSAKFEKIKLIVTAIKSDYKIANKKELQRLNREKQKELVDGYLGIYGKKLTYDVDELLRHDMTQNTLFLRTLLEEIRLLGVYETISSDISEYLKAKDVKELFVKIFRRYERDYDAVLIREVLSLLYNSRDGLSQNSLLEIMEQTKEVDRYRFYPMILALEEHLVSHGGLYRFFHDYIKDAVESRYLVNDELKNHYKRELVEYFEKQEIDNQRVRELPFQLFSLQDRDRLYAILIDIPFFVAIQEFNEHELLRYIQFVDGDRENSIAEDLTEKLMLKEYCDEEDARLINAVANFLDVVYFYQYEAQLLYKKSLILYEKLLPENHPIITICYNNLASIYDAMGKHKEANKYYKILLTKIIQNDELSSIYNNIAGNYNEMGEYRKALSYYKKSLALSEKEIDLKPVELSLVYNNMAELYSTLGKYKTALFFHQKALSLREKYLSKNDPMLAISYNHLGLVYQNLEENKKAYYFFNKSLTLSLEVYGESHPYVATVYNNIAGYLYRVEEKFDDSLEMYEKALKITRDILGEMHLETAISYNNIAGVYDYFYKYDKALEYYHKSLEIKKKILDKNHTIIAESYNNLAVFHYYNDEYKEAYPYMLKAIEIWQKSFPDNHPDLVGARESLREIENGLKE